MRINKFIAALIGASTILSTLPVDAKMTAAVKIGKKCWNSYEFKDDDFVVELPSSPKSFTHKSEINNLNLEVDSCTYFSDDNNTTYFVIVTRYPSDVPIDFEGVFKRTIDASPTVEILDIRKAQYQEHDSLEFQFTRNDLSIRGMYLQNDNTLYQIFAVYDNASAANSDRFLNSFKLINAE